MYHKIVLAGGNGFLGKVLAQFYRSKAEQVIILSRRAETSLDNIRFIQWDGKSSGAWATELENTDLLVNLAGKSVNCRYTEKNKKEIFSSRLEPTLALAEAIAGLKTPPKLWINAASATIYRHAEDRPQDEFTGDIGTGFSVDVCKSWEQAFFNSVTPNTRKVALRTSMVLGRKEGVFPVMLNLVRFGAGGKQGNGKQYISWIHEQDFARITEWLLKNNKAEGVYNCTAPEAVTNERFMKLLRSGYGTPLGLPTPKWLLELGARIIGTETELVLKSRWVFPKRLADENFTFFYPKVEYALHELLSSNT